MTCIPWCLLLLRPLITPSMMLHGFHQACLKRVAPLHYCVSAGNICHIPAFLAAGCTINDQDFSGGTALHVAACLVDNDKRFKAAEALKRHGVDPAIINMDGYTALTGLEANEAANEKHLIGFQLPGYGMPQIPEKASIRFRALMMA